MFNSQAFTSTLILIGLLLVASFAAQVFVLHRWWPVRLIALAAVWGSVALIIAHIVYLFVGV